LPQINTTRLRRSDIKEGGAAVGYDPVRLLGAKALLSLDRPQAGGDNISESFNIRRSMFPFPCQQNKDPSWYRSKKGLA
jgi:hypothetical protein